MAHTASTPDSTSSEGPGSAGGPAPDPADDPPAGVEESEAAVAPSGHALEGGGRRWGNPHGYDPLAPTPFDTDAT